MKTTRTIMTLQGLRQDLGLGSKGVTTSLLREAEGPRFLIPT